MYKNNSRNSSKLRGFSPIQLWTPYSNGTKNNNLFMCEYRVYLKLTTK